MHRQHLRRLLERYGAAWPDEAALLARFRRFVEDHPDCLLRACRPGHVTASCWILSADSRRCLLTRHRKLGKWLQLGGHVDGEALVWRAALREAQEESGMTDFEIVADDVLDLDVHEIPARGSEPAHLHYDVRFLLRARPGQDLEVSEESLELAWFTPMDLAAVTQEESVLRLQRKAEAVVGAWGEAWTGPDQT